MENKEEISIVFLLKIFYSFWKKNRIMIFLFFLIPIGFMIVYHLNSKKKYESSASFKCENISYNLISQIYSPLVNSVKAGSQENIVQLLGISQDQASVLIQTSISEIKNPNTQTLGCSFVIEIAVTDQNSVKSFEDPIESFFLKNQYVKMIQQAKEEKLNLTYAKINEQISRLDTVQQSIPSALKSQSENSVLSDLGLGQIYSQMANLYNLKFETEENIELISEVKLVSGFLFVQKVTGLTKRILIGIVIGFILTTVVVLWKGIKIVMEEN